MLNSSKITPEIVDNLVELKPMNGEAVPVTTSLKVASFFEKEHFHIMRDIKDLLPKCSESFGASNFGLSSYVTSQNKEQPMYLLTKDGFTMLAMGYTGEKAMRFKEAYINAFNEMQRQLSNRNSNASMTIDHLMALREFITVDCGAKGTQATRALDRAWRKLYGYSPLALTGAKLENDPDDDAYYYVTTSKIAEMFGYPSARALNPELTKLGLQTAEKKYVKVKDKDTGEYLRDEDGTILVKPAGFEYMPTELGERHGAKRVSNSTAGDVNKEVWNLLWHKEKLPAYLEGRLPDFRGGGKKKRAA